MAPQAADSMAASRKSPAGQDAPRGPNPGSVTLSAPFVSELKIQKMIKQLGTDPSKEETNRIQGVELIHKVRCAIRLPSKTFATACCYYHKFRLCYRDTESNFQDVALACLFVASKTEDTPKKSREVLCAAYNMKNPSDQKTPDDKFFEASGKVIIGIERMILELVAFDFSGRYPQHAVAKVVRMFLRDKDAGRKLYNVAFDMSIDMYKTYAPLKQTTYTMALAIFELSCRLMGGRHDIIAKIDPSRFSTSRACIIETMLDLLDLYSQSSKNTLLGTTHSATITYSRFLSVKIDLNQEIDDTPGLNRYSLWCKDCDKEPISKGRPGAPNHTTPNLLGIPVLFSTGRVFGTGGTGPPTGPSANHNHNTATSTSPSAVNGTLRCQGSMSVDNANGTSNVNGNTNSSGPARFVFDRDEARKEGHAVSAFFEDRYDEYEVEVEESVPEPRVAPPTAPAESRRGIVPPRGPAHGDPWGRRRGGGPGHDVRRGHGPGPRGFY